MKKDVIQEYMAAVMRANTGYTKEELEAAAKEHFRYEDIEVVIQMLMCVNSHAISRVLSYVEKVRKGDAVDGRLRSILNATEKKARQKETLIASLTQRSGVRAGEDDFVTAMADCLDEFDDIVDPVFSAVSRCIEQFFLRKHYVKDDCSDMAAASLMLLVTSLNRELYDALARRVYPAIDSIEGYSNALSGVVLEQQVAKIVTNLYGMLPSQAIHQAKGVSEMLSDYRNILFSTETCNRIFAPRGGHIEFARKSLLSELDSKTMSLNYYKLHYMAAYR